MIFLGAGASAPVGIPTATTLTKETRNLLRIENQERALGALPKESIIRMSADFGSRNAISELFQKWFPITIRNLSIPDENQLLSRIAEWRNKKEAEYVR
jgi:hypothetical protein